MTIVQNPILAMRRREIKFILNPEQEAFFRRAIKDHMAPDEFGLTTISSLYYDTPDRKLIVRSLEGGVFKEKIRLRSYGLATDDSPVFLELKRKAEGIVYKRRVRSTLPQSNGFFLRRENLPDGQIAREITCFRDLYKELEPSFLILCERTAFQEPDGDLRLTIDTAPRYRIDRLDLRLPPEGEALLPEGFSILEIKVQQAMPLWLTGILDRSGIRKTSFSKVGKAYQIEVQKKWQKRSVQPCLNPFIPTLLPQTNSSSWRSPRLRQGLPSRI